MRRKKIILEEMNDLITNFTKKSEIIQKIDGEAVIQLDLQNSLIYQEFSGKNILCEEIFSYIEKAYSYVPLKTSVKLDVLYPEEMSIEEQKKIQQMIQVHYAIQFKEINREIFKTNLKGAISLGIGALLFFIFGLLEWFDVNFIFRGIIEIFSWVFIWEACNAFAFTNSKNKLDRFFYLRLFKASHRES